MRFIDHDANDPCSVGNGAETSFADILLHALSSSYGQYPVALHLVQGMQQLPIREEK
jgi:hypothetical protein